MVAVEEFPTDLVLGRIADEALCVRESHIGGRHSIALVVGDDLYSVVLPDAHTPAKRAPTSHRQRKVTHGHCFCPVTSNRQRHAGERMPNEDMRREPSLTQALSHNR